MLLHRDAPHNGRDAMGIRFIAPLLLAATLSATLASAAPPPRPVGEFAPRGYLCLRADRPLVIDGVLDERDWEDARPSERFVDIEGTHMPLPWHDTTVRMLWDDDCFYFGAELVEPHLWATLTERDAIIYHDNDFEIFLDPDGDTHDYFELEINALNTVWDLFLERPYRDGGPAIHEWDIDGLRTAVALDGTVNDPSDHDRGWTVEIAIPWAALAERAGAPCPPRDGDRWRVNFSRVQWRLALEDDRYVKLELPEYNWVWSPQGLINMHYPEMWGVVEFASSHIVGSRTVASDRVERAGWALRQVYFAEREYRHEHGAYTPLEVHLDIDTGDMDRTWLGLFPMLQADDDTFTATLSVTGRGELNIDQTGRLWWRER